MFSLYERSSPTVGCIWSITQWQIEANQSHRNRDNCIMTIIAVNSNEAKINATTKRVDRSPSVLNKIDMFVRNFNFLLCPNDISQWMEQKMRQRGQLRHSIWLCAMGILSSPDVIRQNPGYINKICVRWLKLKGLNISIEACLSK